MCSFSVNQSNIQLVNGAVIHQWKSHAGTVVPECFKGDNAIFKMTVIIIIVQKYVIQYYTFSGDESVSCISYS